MFIYKCNTFIFATKRFRSSQNSECVQEQSIKTFILITVIRFSQSTTIISNFFSMEQCNWLTKSMQGSYTLFLHAPTISPITGLYLQNNNELYGNVMMILATLTARPEFSAVSINASYYTLIGYTSSMHDWAQNALCQSAAILLFVSMYFSWDV